VLTPTPAPTPAPPLADLTLSSSDITFSPVNPAPGQPVTINATIRNQGVLGASTIDVTFLDFGVPIGQASIASLGAGQSAGVSVTATFPDASFRLITVRVDPSNAITELNESNNEASQVLQVGTPNFADAVMNVQASSVTTCQGRAATVSGSAFYDFASVPGTQDFPVQGGQVTIKVDTLATYTGAHTDVNGNFSLALLAPATDGVYPLLVKVTDTTLTGETQAAALTVSGPCPTPPPAPPIGSGGGGGGTSTRDVKVFSADIYFSDPNPDIGESINIFAYIHYFGSQPATDVPVAINDIFPVGGMLHTFQIGSALVDLPGGGSESTVVVSLPWTNTAAGAHVIQVVAAPPFSQDTSNDKATKAIFVGPQATLAIDKSAALLNDSDSSGSYSPGDTVRYTITYTNTGASAVTGAQIIDDFDDTFLEPPFNVSPPGTVSVGTITWSIGTIAAGGSGSVSYDVNIRPPSVFPGGTTIIVNNAFLTTDQAPSVPNVSDTAEIEVTKQPSGSGGPPVVGGVVGLVESPAVHASDSAGSGGAMALYAALAGVAAMAIGASAWVRLRRRSR